MELKLAIPVDSTNKFQVMLQLLSHLKPFSSLRKRELQVFAELLKYNNRWKELPDRERNTLIFNYDTRLEIAEVLGISVDNVYTVIEGLKKKQFIVGEKNKNSLNPSYALAEVDKIIFTLA